MVRAPGGGRRRRGAARLSARSALLSAFALAACAAPDRFTGIDLRPGGAEPGLQRLAAAAHAGDRHAAYTLGVLYEGGYGGVAADPRRALALYRQAATRSGGTVMIYQPPVTKGGRGQVVPIDTCPVREGLPQAKRLAALTARLADAAPR